MEKVVQCWVGDRSCKGAVVPVAMVETPTRHAFDLCVAHLAKWGEAVREIK